MNASAATTFGNYDCSEWFSRNVLARAWLLGHLSGLSAADPKEGLDVLERLNSADQAFIWMDNYCKANPLKMVDEGAMGLYIELENMQ